MSVTAWHDLGGFNKLYDALTNQCSAKPAVKIHQDIAAQGQIHYNKLSFSRCRKHLG